MPRAACGFVVSTRVLCGVWAAQWRVFHTHIPHWSIAARLRCAHHRRRSDAGDTIEEQRRFMMMSWTHPSSLAPERVRNADSDDGPCVIGSGWAEADSTSRERTHTQSGHRSAQRITKGPLVLASPSHFSRPMVNQLIIPQRVDHRDD
jgi:hypothetical protein